MHQSSNVVAQEGVLAAKIRHPRDAPGQAFLNFIPSALSCERLPLPDRRDTPTAWTGDHALSWWISRTSWRASLLASLRRPHLHIRRRAIARSPSSCPISHVDGGDVQPSSTSATVYTTVRSEMPGGPGVVGDAVTHYGVSCYALYIELRYPRADRLNCLDIHHYSFPFVRILCRLILAARGLEHAVLPSLCVTSLPALLA